MDFPLIAYALPLVYFGLQFDALSRMTGSWRTLSCFPIAILVGAVMMQFYASALTPELESHLLPLAGFGLAVAYLIGLFALHWLTSPVYVDEIDRPEREASENVLWLDAYRGLTPPTR